MSVISTQSRLARPSTVIATKMTDKERLALGSRDIALCLDAREVAVEYATLTLRDRIGARPVRFNGGVLGTINGNPAVDLDGASGLMGVANYQMPASYFVATAIEFDTLDDTASLAASVDQSGSRMFFGVVNPRVLRLDHGLSAALSTAASAVPLGRCVLWGSYDASTGRAEIGVNAVTATAVGTIPNGHKGQAQTNFWGGTGTQSVDGKGGLLVVADRYLGGAQNTAMREIILGWLADYAGVAMAA